MKYFALIVCALALADANQRPLPYDVYVRYGGKPLPEILRNKDQLYYLAEPLNNTFIVGGTPAAEGDAPWIVSIRMTSHFCGGSIYTQRTIVTAAHCVDGDSPSQLSIRYNTLTHASGGTLVGVDRIIVHPNYSPSAINNDVAILQLSADLVLGGAQAQNIQLPLQGSDPSEGTNTLCAGWGTTCSGCGSLPPNLLKVTVPIVGRAKCQSQYGASSITTAMICAGVPEGGLDACQGDSGGPLTVGNQLVGIVSWGRGCALPDYAGVYTNVGQFVDWINTNTIS